MDRLPQAEVLTGTGEKQSGAITSAVSIADAGAYVQPTVTDPAVRPYVKPVSLQITTSENVQLTGETALAGPPTTSSALHISPKGNIKSSGTWEAVFREKQRELGKAA